MKGRPNIHQNEELVLKAQAIFWQKGYSATSLTDLSTATGAGAGSLYNTFRGGKKQLFKESLQQRMADFTAFKGLLDKSDKPLELIKKFFLEVANADTPTHLKGCIVANTIVEMTFVDNELEEEAVKILKKTEQLYTSVIATAQEKGQIKSSVPAEVLGKFLICLWCGINSLRRIYPDKEILKTQLALQMQILD